MSERPILFSGPMVRAILDGRKTQTRRIVKPCKELLFGAPLAPNEIAGDVNAGDVEVVPMPYGVPGDRLWVRETWTDFCPIWDGAWCGHGTIDGMKKDHEIYYAADNEAAWKRGKPNRWRSPIHMPRWASRLTLEVVSVRVEKLQEISAKDILAEGAVLRAHDDQFGHNPVSAFDGMVYMDLKSLWAAGWNSINAKRASWRSNPWVWVIEFKRAK